MSHQRSRRSGQQAINELADQKSNAWVGDAVEKCINSSEQSRYKPSSRDFLLPSEINDQLSEDERSQVESCLYKVRDAVDAFRSNTSKTLLGSEQLDWFKRSSQNHSAVWTVVSQEIVAGDRFEADFEGALESAQANHETEDFNFYREYFYNITEKRIDTVYDYSNSPKKAGDPLLYPKQDRREKSLPSSLPDVIARDNVLGRYNITTGFGAPR